MHTLPQVSADEDLDGYRHMMSVSEWWKFKTPFASWYAKSFANVVKPMLADWNFGPDHVPCMHFACCCFPDSSVLLR